MNLIKYTITWKTEQHCFLKGCFLKISIYYCNYCCSSQSAKEWKYPPKIHSWGLLFGVMVCGGKTLQSRDTKEPVSCSVSTMGECSEKWPSSDTHSSGTLNLTFPTSKTIRNKYLMLIPLSLWHISFKKTKLTWGQHNFMDTRRKH